MHGNTARGKLSPANPHLTNPVPLSHTTTFSRATSMVAAIASRPEPTVLVRSPRAGDGGGEGASFVVVSKIWKSWRWIPGWRETRNIALSPLTPILARIMPESLARRDPCRAGSPARFLGFVALMLFGLLSVRQMAETSGASRVPSRRDVLSPTDDDAGRGRLLDVDAATRPRVDPGSPPPASPPPLDDAAWTRRWEKTFGESEMGVGPRDDDDDRPAEAPEPTAEPSSASATPPASEAFSPPPRASRPRHRRRISRRDRPHRRRRRPGHRTLPRRRASAAPRRSRTSPPSSSSTQTAPPPPPRKTQREASNPPTRSSPSPPTRLSPSPPMRSPPESSNAARPRVHRTRRPGSTQSTALAALPPSPPAPPPHAPPAPSAGSSTGISVPGVGEVVPLRGVDASCRGEASLDLDGPAVQMGDGPSRGVRRGVLRGVQARTRGNARTSPRSGGVTRGCFVPSRRVGRRTYGITPSAMLAQGAGGSRSAEGELPGAYPPEFRAHHSTAPTHVAWQAGVIA